jgi:hypothetical protein
VPGKPGDQEVERKTGPDGKVVWRLVHPASVSVEWKPPYFLLDKKWIKDKGIAWEARVEKIVAVKLAAPRPPDADGKLPCKQFVNLAADASDPSRGSKIKVKVVPAGADKLDKGRKIFLKAEFGAGNGDRKNSAGEVMKGKTHAESKGADEKGEAEFEIEVGYAGGEKITLSVGSTDECKDDKVVIETWRKLYYELMAPECMKPRLGKLVVGGKDVWDLKQTTRDWAAERLKRVHVQYECKQSHIFEDAKVSKWLHPGSYLGKPAGDYYVLGSPAAYDHDPVAFGAAENRTIFVRCCDVVSDAFPASAMEQDVHAADSEHGGPDIFLVDPGTGNPSVEDSVRWEAVPGAGAAATHPGQGKSGTLPRAAIELKTRTTYAIHLSGEPAALVGPASATKCPIRVRWQWRRADPYNGSASGGRQLMNLGRPLKPVAATICHELGHSMGQTVIENGRYKRKPPDGLEYPPVVPAGEVYDGHGHVGSHCAAGLTAAEKGRASYGALQGTCIMFGAGGDEEEPARQNYCDTCNKYIRSRNLSDVRSGWTARASPGDY